MEKIQKAWNWLSGKKTVIGMGFILAGKIISIAGQPVIGDLLNDAGLIIGGGGLLHKSVKQRGRK